MPKSEIRELERQWVEVHSRIDPKDPPCDKLAKANEMLSQPGFMESLKELGLIDKD